MRIAKETWAIMAIGIADLISTIIFIRHHGANEANPLFRHYWDMGLAAFISAKLALLAGPLIVLEWARRRSPVFVGMALRTAIAGYLLLYSIGVVRLNMQTRGQTDYTPLSEASHGYDVIARQFRHHRPMKRSPVGITPTTFTSVVD